MLSKNQIKYIKDLSRKQVRMQERKFVVEGEKLIAELLQGDVFIEELYALERWTEQHAELDVTVISEKELSRISQLKTPNKVLAVVPMFDDQLEIESCSGLTLFLDRINDPGNLGTIIRMADWFGIGQIVCSENSVDVYNSKVIQSSMGSAFRIPVYYREGVSFLKEYAEVHSEYSIVGAAMSGKLLNEYPVPQNGVLVMGSESHGIHPEIEKCLRETITIPRFGEAESLNVAMATGIILWEWNR